MIFAFVDSLESPEKLAAGREEEIHINIVIPRIVSQMDQHFYISASPEILDVISLVSCSPCLRLFSTLSM